MESNARKKVLVGLGVGLVCAGLSAAVWWRPVTPEQSSDVLAPPVDHAAGRGDRVPPRDLAALQADIDRLKGHRDDTERLSAELKRELAALRTQRPQGHQGQEAMSGALEQRILQLIETQLRHASASARDQAAETPPSPEHEEERAEAHLQAQMQVMEGTLHREPADPAWAPAAEEALQEVFQHEEVVGLHLVEAHCRTTLCRLALSRTGAVVPDESFRQLVHLLPWHRQGFVHIKDDAAAEMVVYLAREGHPLPQGTE